MTTFPVAQRDQFLAIANPAAYDAAYIEYEKIQKLCYVRMCDCALSVSDIFMVMRSAGYRAGGQPFGVAFTRKLKYRDSVTAGMLTAAPVDHAERGAVRLISTAYGAAA